MICEIARWLLPIMGRSGHQVIQNEDGEHDDDYVSLNSLLTIDDEYNEVMMMIEHHH